MYISEIVTTVPENVSERVPLEQKVYKVFDKLGIPVLFPDAPTYAPVKQMTYVIRLVFY